MKVLIIGGGIGGLCLAHGLERAGIDFTAAPAQIVEPAPMQFLDESSRTPPHGDFALTWYPNIAGITPSRSASRITSPIGRVETLANPIDQDKRSNIYALFVDVANPTQATPL